MEASTSPEVWIVEDLQQQKLPARSLVATLQRAGLSARLVDLNQGLANLVAAAQREPPRLIISSILFADRVNEYLALTTALRAAGVRAHLSLTGHLPTLAGMALLAACPALDSVLAKDAGRTAAQLAKQLDRPEEWKTIPGLLCRDSGSRAAPRTTGDELDQFLFPLCDDVPLFHGYGYATIEASRGCYHACTFCLPAAFYRQGGVPYRLREMANMMEGVEALYARGARLFLFDDEQFLPPGRARAERVAAFAEELERRNLRIAFTIKCRADDIEVDLFRRLKQAGLLRVYIGVESGCQATLDLLNKQTTVQQNVAAVERLNELGLVADFRLLLFHPWTTLEMIETELAFLQRVSACISTPFDVREAQVFAGTPLAGRLLSEGRGNASDWLFSFTIADPRVELLRRLCRLVFDLAGVYGDYEARVSETWYALLLANRFEACREQEDSTRLQSAVARMNEEMLNVWEEMLAFARTGDIYDANEVNTRAGGWVERVGRAASASSADLKNNRFQDTLEFDGFGSPIPDKLV